MHGFDDAEKVAAGDEAKATVGLGEGVGVVGEAGGGNEVSAVGFGVGDEVEKLVGGIEADVPVAGLFALDDGNPVVFPDDEIDTAIGF